NCSATRQPSSAGIITSSRITSGRSSRAISRPVGPSLASSTSIFSASRFTQQSSRIGASSSIPKTRVMPRRRLYPRPFFLNRARAGRDRELEREPRPFPFLRLDGDSPPHRRDEALRDEQSESGAGRRDCAAVELAEDPLLLGQRDADAFVLHAELDAVGRATRGDRDGA